MNYRSHSGSAGEGFALGRGVAEELLRVAADAQRAEDVDEDDTALAEVVALDVAVREGADAARALFLLLCAYECGGNGIVKRSQDLLAAGELQGGAP